LTNLTRESVNLASRTRARILVNDRSDIAAACADAGVHLTTRSMTASTVRQAFGDRMLIGVSTHNLDEVREAETGGADFVVFGPVFETVSKAGYGRPAGLESLKAAASSTGIPVLALGGITTANFREALGTGAAGIAGISIFTNAVNLARLVAELKTSL
jgi:thiamine-phosphate pyrophosphorylase